MELENVKVGDKVIYSHRYNGDTIAEVEKITQKYIIVKGNKYKKNRWKYCIIRPLDFN